MALEANKALVRRFFELSDEHDLAAAQELLAPSFVYHSASLPAGDRDAVRRMEEEAARAIPDGRTIVEDVIAEGDRVVVRYTSLGTFRLGILGVAPTGRPIRQRAIAIHRVRDGKIQEVWVETDRLSLRQQLGLEPGPGGA